MIKMTMLLLGLCLSTSSWGMINEKTMQKDEVVTLLCEGMEIKLDQHLARMSEVLKSGFEDAGTNGSFSLPSVISLSTWEVVQGLLERVSHCEDDQEEAPQSRKEILEVLKGLDAPTLIKLLVAVDCLDIPSLLPSVLQVAREIGVLALSVEELEMVPLDMRWRLVMCQAVNHLGPLPGKVIATYAEQEGDVFLAASCTVDPKAPSLIYWIDEQGTFRLYERDPLILESKEETMAKRKLLAICPNHKERKFLHMMETDNGTYCSNWRDGTFSLWDRDGNDLVVFKGHTGEVTSVCRMRDGKIASASDDNTVRVWNSTTGEQLFICTGHAFRVGEVCMLPDGNLASGSADSTMRIWDSCTGMQLALCGEVVPSSWGVSVFVTDDGSIVSQGLISSPGLLSVLGGHFSSSKKITHVWDISLVNRLKNAQEEHIQEVWLYLQEVARQKKLSTFNESAGWDAIARILDQTDDGVLSRLYGYMRGRLHWSLGWKE